MGGEGLLHSSSPANLKLNCCFALLTSKRKSLQLKVMLLLTCVFLNFSKNNLNIVLNSVVVSIWSQVIFFLSSRNNWNGRHQVFTSKIFPITIDVFKCSRKMFCFSVQLASEDFIGSIFRNGIKIVHHFVQFW